MKGAATVLKAVFWGVLSLLFVGCATLSVSGRLSADEVSAAMLMVDSTIVDNTQSFIDFKLYFDKDTTVVFKPGRKYNYIKQLGLGDHILRRIDILNESSNTVEKSFVSDLKFRLDEASITILPVKIRLDLRQTEAYSTTIYYGFEGIDEDELKEYLTQSVKIRPSHWSVQEFRAQKRVTKNLI